MTETVPEEAKSYGVTESGKVYWNKRNALGQFVTWRGTNRSTRAWTLAAWHAYKATRLDQAEQACRGVLVSRPGLLRGVRGSRLLLPGASARWASEELLAWLEDHGPTLTYREFCAQL